MNNDSTDEACGEHCKMIINEYNILVGDPEGKRPLQWPRGS